MSRKPKVDAWVNISSYGDATFHDSRREARFAAAAFSPPDRIAHLVEQSPAAAKELRALRAVAMAAEKFERAGFPLGRARAEFVEAVERMRRQSEGVAR